MSLPQYYKLLGITHLMDVKFLTLECAVVTRMNHWVALRPKSNLIPT